MGLGDAIETVSGFSVSKSKNGCTCTNQMGQVKTHGLWEEHMGLPLPSFLPSFLLWPFEDHHFGQIKVSQRIIIINLKTT